MKKRAERKDMDADFEKLLSEHFGKVEKALLPCPKDNVDQDTVDQVVEVAGMVRDFFRKAGLYNNG